jgi:Xaa-Pro aminopeptidase
MGMDEKEATLLLIPNGKVKEILITPSGEWPYAEENPSADAIKPDEMMRLWMLLREQTKAYVPFGELTQLSDFRRLLSMMTTLENVGTVVADLRAIKNDAEIENLRKACRVTAESLNDVFRAVEAGMREMDLKLILEYGIGRRKSSGMSFLQAASGPNAVNIHFGATERELADGDIIVFDVGAYWEGYTSDISRTIPVSGKFTKAQRDVYQIVLDAQKAAIQQMVPESKMDDVEKIAQDVLIDGLYELGLVLDKDSQWQRRFFIQHGFGHFIGLDVHDVWYEYRRDEDEKIYEPGMIMTMEPGLYFPGDMLDSRPRRIKDLVGEDEFTAFADKIRPVYEKYIHIGVRIEDDVLITDEGNEILTSDVPKEIKAIETMMKQKSPHENLQF